MSNLLQETKEVLEREGLTEKDVKWCGGIEFGWFKWETFAVLANKDYDRGFGGQEVCKDLIIVGKNWWLERHDYDGSEWWEYKTMPKKPAKKTPATVFAKSSWETLSEAHDVNY